MNLYLNSDKDKYLLTKSTPILSNNSLVLHYSDLLELITKFNLDKKYNDILNFLNKITLFKSTKNYYAKENIFLNKENSLQNYLYRSNKNLKFLLFTDILYLEEQDIQQFNEKNLKNSLNFKNLEQLQKHINNLSLFKKEFENINDNNLNMTFIYEQIYLIEDILNEFKNKNKTFNFYKDNFTLTNATEIIKEINDSSLSSFNAYYIFENNLNSWISIKRNRRQNVEFDLSFEGDIKNATLFNKNIDIVIKELKLHKNNLTIIQAKIEPTKVIFPENITNISDKIQKISSIIEKNQINKQLNKVEQNNIKNLKEDENISNKYKTNKI